MEIITHLILQKDIFVCYETNDLYSTKKGKCLLIFILKYITISVFQCQNSCCKHNLPLSNNGLKQRKDHLSFSIYTKQKNNCWRSILPGGFPTLVNQWVERKIVYKCRKWFKCYIKSRNELYSIKECHNSRPMKL